MDKPSARLIKEMHNHESEFIELEIHLKSGQTINVRCENWKFEINNLTGEFYGYEFQKMISPKALGIVPSQIAGYICK